MAHLAFSHEIIGADILEKLSLTNEKFLFVSDFVTFSNALYDTCFEKLSLTWKYVSFASNYHGEPVYLLVKESSPCRFRLLEGVLTG